VVVEGVSQPEPAGGGLEHRDDRRVDVGPGDQGPFQVADRGARRRAPDARRWVSAAEESGPAKRAS